MARDLATTLTELDSAIKAENSAWAASRGHAENAHLAAIRPMLKGPTADPNNPNEHCLPYLEELITKCQRAVREIEHDLPPAPKQVYKAFMGRLLDINTSVK